MNSLKQAFKNYYLLNDISGILFWDNSTNLPSKSVEARSEQMSILSDYIGKNFPSKYYFVVLDERINLYNLNPLVYLRNNHLNYSITWFLLSLSSAVMLLIIRRRNA